MIITFCGHSDFLPALVDKTKVLKLINEVANGERVEFFLGGYGGFDLFAMQCAKTFKEINPKSKIVFVTPYLHKNYTKLNLKNNYDEIIYPNLESVPLRLAIVKRNQWMVDRADIVIAYVDHKWGGAYKTYAYAIKRRKKIYNFAENILII
ncbi:MAG: hypothetical protein ACI4M5_04725 [Christensenellales bacterium]